MTTGDFSIIVALLTPYTDRGTIDLDAIQAHVEVLVGEGVDGLMPCGTTGEGPVLTDAEVEAVVATVVESSAGRVPVYAHVGRPSTQATAALAQAATATGAAALSAVTPYFYEVGDDELRSHYLTVMRAVPNHPLFAYTIPGRTGNDLSPALTESLAADGLAGIKDSTKSFDRHLEYLAVAEAAGPGFAVFMGSDALILDAMRHGSSGAVSAVANLAPHLLVEMKGAVLEGRHEDAQGAQEHVRGLRRHGLRDLKQATSRYLAARGVGYGAAVRPPL
jgi:4-hydroxy-tetrahydrodipicolinate synthase